MLSTYMKYAESKFLLPDCANSRSSFTCSGSWKVLCPGGDPATLEEIAVARQLATIALNVDWSASL